MAYIKYLDPAENESRTTYFIRVTVYDLRIPSLTGNWKENDKTHVYETFNQLILLLTVFVSSAKSLVGYAF